MTEYKRRTSISFTEWLAAAGKADATPEETEWQTDFEVVRRFPGEGDGPQLVDLSHRPKWDLQDRDPGRISPFGLTVPETPGDCRMEKGILISRWTPTRAAIWGFSNAAVTPPAGAAVTDVTDGYSLLAVIGTGALLILEKLSNLDFADPAKTPPFLLQGPVNSVPCKTVVLSRKPHAALLLVAFSRGYGQAMAEAVLSAGAEFDLTPAGEKAFWDSRMM
jgi:hypothetical protein